MKHIGTNTIQSSRLTLRRFSLTDANDMLKYWISDPKIQLEYAEPVYTTKKEVLELLSKWDELYNLPHFYRWTITIKGINKSIGQIAFYNVDLQNNWCEIEYCISREFQNYGYVTEALNAVLDYGFCAVGFHRIQISHRTKNVASGKVIRKCGMKYEGTLRDAFFYNDEYDDRVYYSLLENEYK